MVPALIIALNMHFLPMEFLSQFLVLGANAQVFEPEAIGAFAIVLVVILIVPIIFERLRIPGLIGLVLAGTSLGPSGWNLVHANSSIMNLLANIGLVYLMFIAGLEVDTDFFRCHLNRSLGFGCFSFGIPLILGTFLARLCGFEWNTALLIGSLLSSYSLLGYPIISRLGVLNNQAIATTIGANILSDFGALLIFSVCLVIHQLSLNVFELLAFLGWLTIYSTLLVAGFYWAGKEFFRRSGDDEGNQFLFVVLAVFLATAGAQLLGIEKIIGAFLAGFALNELLGKGAVKEKLLFVGNVLLIPIFFVNLGVQVNLASVVTNPETFKLTVLLVIILLISKFVAATMGRFIYHYKWQETLSMWSLSLPQAGTTLAASIIGFRAELINEQVLSSIIALMLVSSALGPLITSKVSAGLNTAPITEKTSVTSPIAKHALGDNPYTIVVPVYNPQTQQHLMEMAALLVRQTKGKIIPLAIATAANHMDAPQVEASLQRSERLLVKATGLSQLLGVEAEPLLRIDDAFARGISRAAREQKASLIVMGWGKRTGIRARLFGNVIDSVVGSSHCPVAISRLMESPSKIQRILVPVENLVTATLLPIQLAQIFAEANKAQVTVLNVCERRTSSSKIASRRSQLNSFVSKVGLTNPPEVQIIAHENTAQAVLQAARLYDLVILPFIRNRTVPGGLAISDVTNQLARQLTCSIIMLGEPQRAFAPVFSPEVSSKRVIVR